MYRTQDRGGLGDPRTAPLLLTHLCTEKRLRELSPSHAPWSQCTSNCTHSLRCPSSRCGCLGAGPAAPRRPRPDQRFSRHSLPIRFPLFLIKFSERKEKNVFLRNLSHHVFMIVNKVSAVKERSPVPAASRGGRVRRPSRSSRPGPGRAGQQGRPQALAALRFCPHHPLCPRSGRRRGTRVVWAGTGMGRRGEMRETLGGALTL